MITSLYNGIAGMKAHQNGIDLISDNISNVNTTGYRATTPLFSTIFSQQLNSVELADDPTANDLGYGSVFNGSETNFNNGSLIDSDNQYDLAIQGSGFFGVKDTNGEILYTRDGSFSRDAKGMLVNNNGDYVMGISAYNIQGDRIINNPHTTIKSQKAGNETPIHIPDSLTYPAKPSTFVKFAGSLDPSIKTKIDNNGKRVQIPNLEIFQAEVQDNKGNTNKLAITFTKQVPQIGDSTTWDAKAELRDENGDLISTKEGTVKFNGFGALIYNNLTSIDNNGAPLRIDLGTTYKRGVAQTGYDGLRSIQDAQERSVQKDGAKSGELEQYFINEKGELLASFSNGVSVPIAKIALYHFRNESGLEKVGSNHFKASANSGQPTFFIDKKGNFVDPSTIQSSKLETSNVDLTTALTELIAMQKAFDASSKSITTSDQLIQNAINMKR